jgi:hypothetical protein
MDPLLAPAQWSAYVVVAVSGGVRKPPLGGLSPDQPPEAWHVMTFSPVHESHEFSPTATVAGLATN